MKAVKNSIYFCTIEDIEQEQELRVWYSPFYADKMGVQILSNQSELAPNLDEEFQEIFSSLQNGVNEGNLSRAVSKRKKRRKIIPNTILLGYDYYQGLQTHNDLLPGELLGVKVKRAEWQCKECGQVETCVPAFARHLMKHNRTSGPNKLNCPYCPRYFRKDGYNRTEHIENCKKKHDSKNATKCSAKSSTSCELGSKLTAHTTSITVCDKIGPINLNNHNISLGLPVTESDKASIESFISNLNIENENDNPFLNTTGAVLNKTDNFVKNNKCDKEVAGAKEVNNLTEQSNIKKESESYQNENAQVDKRMSAETPDQVVLNVEEKRFWKDDGKLFESEKNNVCLNALTENLLTKSHLNTPILDLSDDIDFSITKSFTEMINEDCNLDKSMSFVKTGRNLDFFEGVQGSSLLSNEISMPHSSSLEQSSYYSLEKSGFLQSSFNSCDDVTDEEKYRIVENLLSETEDKFLGSDYDMADGCANEPPLDSECMNESKKESEVKNDKRLEEESENVNNFKCQICEKSFKKQMYLYRHLYKHTGNFRCNYCYLVFARKETLIKHRLSCSTEAATKNSVTRISVPCPICKLQLHSLSSLHEHIDTHYCNGDIWVCACEKVSHDVSLIENHNCPFEAVSISCVDCSKVFSSSEDFTYHKEHPKKSRPPLRKDCSLVCEVCGLTFKTRNSINAHRKTHGERQHECEICTKKFIRWDTMMLHRQRHDDPLWECPLCQKRFSSKGLYRQHHKSLHAAINYKCQYCEKLFRQKGNLKKHLKTHEPSKVFKCDVCGSKFKSSENLEYHRSLHESKESFSCITCNKSFLLKFHLKTHIRRAHGEMYLCKYCNMHIRYRHALKKHLFNKHKDKTEEWNSTEALMKMQIQRDPGSVENITCNPSVRDILQTAADEILETEQFQPNKSTLEVQGELQEAYIQEESACTSLTKEQLLANNVTSSDGPLQLITLNIGSAPGNDGEIRLVDDSMQEAVITLPFSVLQNFPTASISETNQTTFLKDITIDLHGSESEGACELVENMESVILSAPLELSEDYQLIDQTQLDKQMEEDSSSLLDIDSIQNVNGTSAFIVSDSSIMDPNTSEDNNMIFYIIETPGADTLT